MWLDKPVRIDVSTSAGSPSGNMARLIGDQLPGFDAGKNVGPVVRVGVNPNMVAVNPVVPFEDL